MLKVNPPWTASLLVKHWERIRERVGDNLMPVRLAGKAKKFTEYGTGSYGTVMPTGTPGVVIKITSDASEAAFVASYLSLPKHVRPNGIVRYHKVFALPGESHIRRPVFVLWRDEASFVGDVGAYVRSIPSDTTRDYLGRSWRLVERNVENCLMAARSFRKVALSKTPAQIDRAAGMISDAWDMGVGAMRSRDVCMRMAWFLNVFKDNADGMQSEPMGIELGRALGEMLDEGLFMADLHFGNIGMPASSVTIDAIGMTPIITDPGHVVALNDRFRHVAIEAL